MLECLALEIGIVVYTGITHQLIDSQTYLMSSINLSSNDMSLITSEIVAAIISEVGDNLRLITQRRLAGFWMSVRRLWSALASPESYSLPRSSSIACATSPPTLLLVAKSDLALEIKRSFH